MSDQSKIERTLAKPPRHRKTREYVASLVPAKPSQRPFFVMLPDLPAEPPKLRGGTRDAAMKAVGRKKKSGVFVPNKALVRRMAAEQAARERFELLLSKLPPVPEIEPREADAQAIPTIVRHDKVRRRRRGDYIDIRRLISAQGNKCGICGETLPPVSGVQLADPMSAVTVDHVVPISRGGRNFGNIVAAHMRCNNRKADRMPTDYETHWLDIVNAALAKESPDV